MASSFANLFLGMFETNALTNVGSLPHGEDILMIFYDLDRRSRFLKIFVDYLSNIHPTIKFTSSHSLTNVPFFRRHGVST